MDVIGVLLLIFRSYNKTALKVRMVVYFLRYVFTDVAYMERIKNKPDRERPM